MERQALGGTLVLGGGFAGAYVARLLGKHGATIVSPQNSMLYTPLLPEAASGTLEPRHVVVPLRQMCPHAELVLGSAVSLDTDAHTVAVESIAGPLEIGYERLVVALGAISRVFPVPGLVEHGRGFKDLADAIALRNHVLSRLDAAAAGGPEAELGFVFVGAGYAGVEAIGELNDLAQAALRFYPTLRDTPQRWVLVEAAPQILSEIPRRLGLYAAKRLTRRGIDIRVATTLASYDGETAVLSDGTEIPAHTLVWTAGVKANPLLDRLGLPLDDRGRVRVDGLLRVDGLDGVWALGDGAAVPNEATPGQTDPPTCQHALRQARRLAKNLTGEPRPYSYRMLGQVATLGRYKGIADVLGLHLSGFAGWFVARTYHLYALPLVSRKLRVVADWTIALLFRRDIAELTTLGHPEGLEPYEIGPLLGLRLRTPDLELRLGNEDEVRALGQLAERGVHPPAEMPFGVAWTDRIGEPSFLDEFRDFHREQLASWSPGEWHLNLLVWRRGELVGTQSLAAEGFPRRREVATGSWLGAPFQGRGIGMGMRAAVLELGFPGLGAVAATSGWLEGNLASARVSEKLGYRETGVGEISPRGVPVPHHDVRLDRGDWRSPVPVEIDGLEEALPLFGVG